MDGVTGLSAWRTDDQCPACAAGLFLVGRGELVQVLECRLCGWSETWNLTADADADTSNDTETGSGGDAQ